MVSAREAFARTIIAFEPYASQIVFIGGWVHAVYLADAGAGERPVLTDDIDITIPPRLLAEGRPGLIELAGNAGFELDPISQMGGPVRLIQPGLGDSIIDLDLITEAPNPGAAVVVDGQQGLVAQGFPWQQILLDNSDWKEVGREIHELLVPSKRIRVPTIHAYALHKGLSSITRTRLPKQAKDLVYLHEVLRHPVLGPAATRGLRELAVRYPDPWARWREHLVRVADNARILAEMADQLINADRAQGDRSVVSATVTARLKRVLAETA